MKLSGKKIFLIGFIVILLVGIPLTVYLVQQQQEVRSRAEASTIVAFSPDSTQAAPIQKNVGESIPLDISVDPGKNLVSFVKLEIQYDPDILATDSAHAFQANTTAFPSILEGPVYTPGKIAVTLSVGPDPTKAIQQKVTAATVTLKALKETPAGTPTLVTYSTNTQVLSIGSNDQASENVLSSTTPATIVVGGGAVPTQAIPTGAVPTTATPTTAADPTTAPLPTEPITTPIASPSAPIGDGDKTAPTCSGLVVDRSATGAAPFSITFTANGSDATGGKVNKVSFNFGDGQVSDVTESGGIGTETVNVQASHTYQNAGTYQASAVLTDAGNNVSVASQACQQTITVTEASGSAQPTTPAQQTVVPATGPAELALGAGITAIALIIGGAFLFFML